MIDKDNEPTEDIKLRLRGEACIAIFRNFMEFCDKNKISPTDFKLQLFEDISKDCIKSWEDGQGNVHTEYRPPNEEWHNIRLYLREKDRLL